MRTLLPLLGAPLLSLFLVACTTSNDDGAAMGEACSADEDCASGLVCDVHDGAGECQPEHGHTEGESEGDDHADHGHDEDDHGDHGHDDDEGDADHGDEETTDDGAEETTDTTGDDSGATEETTGPGETDDTGTDTGVSAECDHLCGCLAGTCSSYAEYPFATVDDCHTFCAGLSDSEVTCFDNFCHEAEGGGAAGEHNCEHAWGGLGSAECPG